jgi:hypothetical protein
MARLWLILVLAACPAAADWVEVPVPPGADTGSYERDKLVVDGDRVTYWRRAQFRMPRPTGEALAWSALYRQSIDCSQRTLRTLGYLLYTQDGAVIENVYVPGAVAVPIVKDTAAAAFETALCAIVTAKKEAEAAQAIDPHEAELRRLEKELQALEDTIRQLREDPPAEESMTEETAPAEASAVEAGAEETAASGDTPAAGPDEMDTADAVEDETTGAAGAPVLKSVGAPQPVDAASPENADPTQVSPEVSDALETAPGAPGSQ